MLLILPVLIGLALAAPCCGESFEEMLEDGDFVVRVTSPNSPEGNTVTVAPAGLKSGNEPLEVAAKSEVSRAFLADMDGDNAPELFVVLTSPGSGSSGEVLAWSTNGKRILTPITMEESAEKDLAGYMGHDEFEVMENTLVRRFPVYKENDVNAEATGGWRQFQYKLLPGEAGWRMKIDRVESY